MEGKEMFNIDWSVIYNFLIDKLPWFLSMVIAIAVYELLKKGTKAAIGKIVEHKAKAGVYIAAAASVTLAVYFTARWMGYL